MKAYVIVQETVNDQNLFEAYRKDVLATIEGFSGQFIVRRGQLTVVEGEWPHQRTVVIEFPSRQPQRAGTTRRHTRNYFHFGSVARLAIS